MNDDLFEKAKSRVEDALKETQTQTEDAAAKIGGLLRAGAKHLKKAADATAQAIRDDINNRT